MGRHKGELSKSAVDSGWPHQVILPEHSYARQNYPIIHQFCRGLSLCDRDMRSTVTVPGTARSASRSASTPTCSWSGLPAR